MGLLQSQGDEEGFVVGFAELVDGPVGDLVVGHVGGVLGVGAPVPEGMSVGLGDFLVGCGAKSSEVACVFVEVLFVFFVVSRNF